jgi:hypothetical protein
MLNLGRVIPLIADTPYYKRTENPENRKLPPTAPLGSLPVAPNGENR